MLCCAVLCCAVLYCTVLCCIVPYCTAFTSTRHFPLVSFLSLLLFRHKTPQSPHHCPTLFTLRGLITSLFFFSLSSLYFFLLRSFVFYFLRLNSKCCCPTMRWRSIMHPIPTTSYGRTSASLKAKYVRTYSYRVTHSLSQSVRLSVYLYVKQSINQLVNQTWSSRAHPLMFFLVSLGVCIVCIIVTELMLPSSHHITSHCSTFLSHGALICILHS